MHLPPTLFRRELKFEQVSWDVRSKLLMVANGQSFGGVRNSVIFNAYALGLPIVLENLGVK